MVVGATVVGKGASGSLLFLYSLFTSGSPLTRLKWSATLRENNMMQKIFESFRRFQEQDTEMEKPSDIEAYRLIGLLVIAKRMRRKKADILSDIRAIEGITTVTIEEHRISDTLDFSEVLIKIDTTPLQGGSIRQIIARLQKEVKAVKGVQSFRVASRPEAI